MRGLNCNSLNNSEIILLCIILKIEVIKLLRLPDNNSFWGILMHWHETVTITKEKKKKKECTISLGKPVERQAAFHWSNM